MSSTLDNSAILATITALESQLAALKAQLSGSSVVSAPVGKAGGVVKVKKSRKPSTAPPSAWIIFTKKVRDLLKSNGYTAKAVGVELVQFAATLKDENADLDSWVDADILARRAAWSAPEVSRWESAHGAKGKAGSAANSVVSTGSKAEDAPVSDTGSKKARKNPWAGLSAEDKAAKVKKMADAKAAKKAVATAATATDNNITTSVVAATTEPIAVATSSSSSTTGFQRMSLHGSAYWVNKATGHCYKRNKDGSQGDWAGIFHSSGGPVNGGPYLDDSVTEPGMDGWDDSELVF